MSWDERYAQADYAYGREPNDFLTSFRLSPDAGRKVLCLAEGEGRNAVYLASLGFEVLAVDQSAVGLGKAMKLAAERGTSIRIQVADLSTYEIEPDLYDGIVCIFAHFEKKDRSHIHFQALKGLKKGGFFLLEAYSKEQLQFSTGGPRSIEMLYSLEELEEDLGSGLDFFIKQRIEREIMEGKYHTGIGSVVQTFGLKK